MTGHDSEGACCERHPYLLNVIPAKHYLPRRALFFLTVGYYFSGFVPIWHNMCTNNKNINYDIMSYNCYVIARNSWCVKMRTKRGRSNSTRSTTRPPTEPSFSSMNSITTEPSKGETIFMGTHMASLIKSSGYFVIIQRCSCYCLLIFLEHQTSRQENHWLQSNW